MRKNTLVISLLAAAWLLTACTRSASELPTELLPTEDPIESIFSTVATQTALAAANSGEEEGEESEITPSPSQTAASADVTATPTSTAMNTPAPTPELVVPSSYTLHEGEWPYCLARRFNIDPAAILAANSLSEAQANQLSVGHTLNIPSGAAAYGGNRSLRTHPTEYTASGVDTFYSIACLFGDVWPEAIAGANGKGIDYTPAGGEQLYIP